MRKKRGTGDENREDIAAVAERFKPGGGIGDVRPLGSGNVNDTFLVTLEGHREKHFVLQRVNTRVFARPELVMANLRTFAAHVRDRLRRVPPPHRWEVVRILPARDGGDHWIGPGGSFWRALSFIERARSFPTIKDTDHAREVGRALGIFHALLSDLPPERLFDTLEGFHVTPRYLRRFDEVLEKSPPQGSPEVGFCLDFIRARRARASVLEDARKRSILSPRPIHGDPKVDNILIDDATGRAVGVIDLDTVKPGLVHYDIGDCLRSSCNPLGEAPARWEAVRFEPDLCEAILRGYLPEAGVFLSPRGRDYIYDATRLIAFELGLRFFTDYLEGNVYFKVRHPLHNLFRALVQFRLSESVESQETSLRALIRDVR